MQSLAIYGGTFDPIHKAHLATATAVQQQFHFEAFYFLPCKEPLLKPSANATTEQRVAMLELALEPFPEFHLDLREIQRDSPSYMVETLKSFRQQYPQTTITLILGYDAFLSLPSWHEWQNLIKLAKLVVLDRKVISKKLPEALLMMLDKHQSKNPQDFTHFLAEKIIYFDAGHYDFSSTEIRQKIQAGENVERLLPSKVYDYIKKHKLYRGC